MQDNTIPQSPAEPPNDPQNTPVEQPSGVVIGPAGPASSPSTSTPASSPATKPKQDIGANARAYNNQTVLPKQRSSWKSILSTLALIAAAPLIALTLTAFAFQSIEVDGPSMVPSLADNDRLIVYKFGKTWSRIRGQDYVPKRGEIVIFHRRGLFSYDENLDKQLIKRVIALPGERIVVNNGIILVFNKEHPDGFQPDKELPYGESITNTAGNADYTLEYGQIFVAGDNRNNSLDSREFGPIDSDDLVGTLGLRIFPVSDFKSF